MRINALLVAASAAAFVTPCFAQVGRETLSIPVETAATNNLQLGVVYLNGEIFVSGPWRGRHDDGPAHHLGVGHVRQPAPQLHPAGRPQHDGLGPPRRRDRRRLADVRLRRRDRGLRPERQPRHHDHRILRPAVRHAADRVRGYRRRAPRAVGSIGPFKAPWELTFPRTNSVYIGGFASGTPVSFQAAPFNVTPAGTTITWQAVYLDPTLPLGGACGLTTSLIATNPTTHERTDCFVREDFDALANGPNYPTGWADGGGQQPWLVDDNGTTSANTGPSAAVSGTKSIYAETSSPDATGDTFILNTAVYAAASNPATAVEFQLSRIGDTIGTLEVRLDDGSGTFGTLLGTYTGPEPSGIEWTLETLTLPSPLPAHYQIQLHYTRGTSFTGDLAIDDFCLR